jgi:signal transduction histidine kinase
VIRLAVPAIADYAVLALLTEDGRLGWGWSAHRDPHKAELVAQLRAFVPELTSDDHPWAAAIHSGVPRLISTVDDAYLRQISLNETHLGVLRHLKPASYIVIPLAARGRMLGSLLLACAVESGRRYTTRDLTLATAVGRRISLALDNAMLYRAAEQAARSREDMVAVVSHDLKNPLATIQMAVSFLREEIVPDDEAHAMERKHLDVIQRSAGRMYRLIRDLLDTAAIASGHVVLDTAPTAVYELLIDALELLRPLAAAKRVALTTCVPVGLPRVVADRERVMQVLSNIVGNAIKFTPSGGRVEIDVKSDGSHVEFTVSDTGPGIPASDLPHLFDRFWQARSSPRTGTGLGLPIAKRIVEAHDGFLRVNSELGKGTRFVFALRVAS